MPFGIGPGELILVLVLALIVFGPKRLPELGGSMGRAIREFRRASSELTREFSETTNERPSPPSAQQPPARQAALANIVNCPACGGANPKDGSFCGHCGKALEA